MFIITSLPEMFKSFFKEIRKEFTKEDRNAYKHFWRLVLGIACLSSCVSLSALEGLYGRRRSRQAISHFLETPGINFDPLLQHNAITILRRLGWKAGEPVCLVIDDTQIEKFGKKMEGLSKIFLHAEKRYAFGYSVFVATIVYRGVSVPFYTRLCLSKRVCEELSRKHGREYPHLTLTDIAVNCINALQLPGKTPVVVLFDKYYLCSKVTSACERRGFTYIGAVKGNRKFDCSRETQRVADWATERLTKVVYWRKFSWSPKRLKLSTRTGRLSKAGRVKLAFSRREGENGILILATNRLNLRAEEIVKIYRTRWTIESFFKAAKQNLGMGDFRVLKLQAIESYLYLVMFAHQLLAHQALQQLGGIDQKKKDSPIQLLGITETQSDLRRKMNLVAINKVMNRGLAKNSLEKMVKCITALVANAI